MVVHLLRRRWMLAAVSFGWFAGVAGSALGSSVGCSSTATATGPGATGAMHQGAHQVGAIGVTPIKITTPPPPSATCELAMQNVNRHWVLASAHASANVRTIYANVGSELTPALVALCQTDAWAPTGRTCVAHAANLAAIDICTRQLSASQQAHLQATTAEFIDSVDVVIRPATITGAPQP